MRERAAAVIERDGQLLMVRQRSRGSSGRHDGAEYLTLPGGGIEPDETAACAVAREVTEEVGLSVIRATRISRVEHPGGATTIFSVDVEDGAPSLGVDPEIDCDCPRLVGLAWIAAPDVEVWRGDEAAALLRIRLE